MKSYVIRVQSDKPNTFGLGEVVAEGCAFFKHNQINLSKQELEVAISKLPNGSTILG
jgi:hypothetical protein